MTKRPKKICPDCGRGFIAMKKHKQGVSESCTQNQMIDQSLAAIQVAKAEGWAPVERWNSVVGRSGVPIREVPYVCQGVAEWYYKEWAPLWAMEVARLKGLEAFLRIRAIQRLFDELDIRKVFQTELALQTSPFDRRMLAVQMTRKLNYMSSTYLLTNADLEVHSP